MSDDESDEEAPAAPEGGEGKEKYPYGEYEGGRDENLDRHGFGSALLPNDDIYEGSYVHGKRHGLGLYCFKNGARYYGEWKKGMKHGKGVFYYPDGSKYIGMWRKDLKHGHGFYYYPNGDVYEGNYYKNIRCGLGSYKYADHDVVCYGVWRDGQMNGSGVIRYVPYRFHGYFEKNLPKGPGCFTFEGKYILHGFYVNLKDPAFDYVSNEVINLEENNEENPYMFEYPKGIVPIWRSRNITEYKEELLPPEPEDFPRPESLDSVMDIIEYLQKQYGQEHAMPQEEEEMDENRQNTSPVPVDLIIDEDAPPIPPGNIDV